MNEAALDSKPVATKPQLWHEEVSKGIQGMPASLASLTEVEYNEVGKKATRKLDILIMPALVIMYIFNYLDRQNLSAARLANIEKDLGLSDVDYQTCISILFAGYILMQTPSNIIASKIRWPAVWICLAMCIWGCLSAATAGVKSFGGLLACRFILGFCESVFFPGAIFMLSCFYNKKQLATRAAILYSGSQLGNAFGGLLAIGILKLDGVHGIQGWRWLFIIEGVATVALAAIFATYLPNSPQTCRWLTDIEREHLLWTLRVEQGSSDDRSEISGWQGFVMAVTDPKTWMLMGVLSTTYISAAVVSFFPTVVGTLGFNRTITYVLTAPPYLLTCVVMTINGFHSDKKQERFLHIIGPLFFAIIANVIAVSTLNTGARYFAMCLMPTSYYASAIVTLSWISGSLTQPSVKRATALAFINSFANTPNIWTTYLYKNGPRFTAAFGVNLAASVAAILLACITRIYLSRKNSELEKGDRSARGAPTQEQLDSGFRYVL
ncbi:MFS general substrate transporter [Meredithblackwellia eburnea MCA 4105]